MQSRVMRFAVLPAPTFERTLAEASRIAKPLAEKVEQRPHLGRDVLARRIDGINSEFYRPILGHQFDQRAGGQIHSSR